MHPPQPPGTQCPSVLDQRCYKNLLWKLLVERASARWRVCTWVHVCIGCWAMGPPRSALTVPQNRVPAGRALPVGLARSRRCSVLCSRPASPPCPVCRGTEPPGPYLGVVSPASWAFTAALAWWKLWKSVGVPRQPPLPPGVGGGRRRPGGPLEVSGFSQPLSAASDAEAFSQPSLLGAAGGLGCPRQLLLPSAARELRHLCQWQRPKPQL